MYDHHISAGIVVNLIFLNISSFTCPILLTFMALCERHRKYQALFSHLNNIAIESIMLHRYIIIDVSNCNHSFNTGGGPGGYPDVLLLQIKKQSTA